MKFSQKMPLNVVYTMVQKSQKWPKTQIKGGGPALRQFWPNIVCAGHVRRWLACAWRMGQPFFVTLCCVWNLRKFAVYKKLLFYGTLYCVCSADHSWSSSPHRSSSDGSSCVPTTKRSFERALPPRQRLVFSRQAPKTARKTGQSCRNELLNT